MLDDGTVQIYSRNLENTTSKYPDIAGRMAAALKPGVKSIVLDCEAQAWDADKKVFLPFQVLTTRKRKDVKADDITVQVWCCVSVLYNVFYQVVCKLCCQMIYLSLWVAPVRPLAKHCQQHDCCVAQIVTVWC